MDSFIQSISRPEAGWLCLGVLVLGYCMLPRPTYRTKVAVPTVKFGAPWLPSLLSRLEFNSNAVKVIYGGYRQVRDIFV